MLLQIFLVLYFSLTLNLGLDEWVGYIHQLSDKLAYLVQILSFFTKFLFRKQV